MLDQRDERDPWIGVGRIHELKPELGFWGWGGWAEIQLYKFPEPETC